MAELVKKTSTIVTENRVFKGKNKQSEAQVNVMVDKVS